MRSASLPTVVVMALVCPVACAGRCGFRRVGVAGTKPTAWSAYLGSAGLPVSGAPQPSALPIASPRAAATRLADAIPSACRAVAGPRRARSSRADSTDAVEKVE